MMQIRRRLPILHGMSSLLAAATSVSTEQLIQTKTEIANGLKAIVDAFTTAQLAPVIPQQSFIEQVKTSATEWSPVVGV